MKNVAIYGIKNCDTMKKAFQWLDEHNVSYIFHDYKKAGADTAVLQAAIDQHGWDKVLNRKGTSWRALSDTVKNNMNDANAMKAAIDNPSLIRRPLLVQGKNIHLGFVADEYAKIFE
jgi:arsenate reductase